MKKAQFHEREYALFWLISRELQLTARNYQPQETVDSLLDELEAISVNTEQITLRKRCVSLLAQFRVAEAVNSASL